MVKKFKALYIALTVVIILILGYFFWPLTFKESNLNQDIIIHKYSEGIPYDYQLNEQEVSELIKLVKEAKFYHGVSRPDSMFSDKLVDFRVPGNISPIISIYYDDDKSYVFANISNNFIFNGYYRISNKDKIKNYIENIIDTRTTEFEKVQLN